MISKGNPYASPMMFGAMKSFAPGPWATNRDGVPRADQVVERLDVAVLADDRSTFGGAETRPIAVQVVEVEIGRPRRRRSGAETSPTVVDDLRKRASSAPGHRASCRWPRGPRRPARSGRRSSRRGTVLEVRSHRPGVGVVAATGLVGDDEVDVLAGERARVLRRVVTAAGAARRQRTDQHTGGGDALGATAPVSTAGGSHPRLLRQDRTRHCGRGARRTSQTIGP